MKRAALLCFAILWIVGTCLATKPTSIPQYGSPHYGSSSRTHIWYQSTNSTYAPFTFASVVNPIGITITVNGGQSTYDAAVCISYAESTLPVSGAHLYATCPKGSYGVSSNSTSLVNKKTAATRNPHLNRVLINAADQNNELDSSSSSTTLSLQLNVKPSSNAIVIIMIASEYITDFSFYLTGQQCSTNTYPVGLGQTCVTIPYLPTYNYLTVPAGSAIYFQFTTYTQNEFNIILDSQYNQYEAYLQSGYIPTEEWYLQKVHAVTGSANITVVSPGQNTYFLMILNTSPFNFPINITYTTSYCPSSYFGPACAYSSTTKVPSLSLPVAFNRNSNNEGYFYFQLLSYPNYATPYYIRFSVGNTQGGSAPALYARRGVVPSRDAYDYSIDTQTGANQVMIRINSSDYSQPITPSNAWYFAIPSAHSNFEIWTGYNCANNCSLAGTCYCNGFDCYTETNGGRNLAPLYTRPYTVVDSGGICACNSYRHGFSCNSQLSTLDYLRGYLDVSNNFELGRIKYE